MVAAVVGCGGLSPHLAMVGAVVFGHGTLAVHQEAVPPPLLRERVLVAFSDVVVQFALLVADGFHKLREEKSLHQLSCFEVSKSLFYTDILL